MASLYILLLGILLLPIIFSPNVEASPIHLTIQISTTCLTMLQYNYSTNCPTYQDILLLFPDTSDHKISGDFVFKNGLLKRADPILNNHFKFYQYDPREIIYWIDPPADVYNKATKKIVLAPHDFIFALRNQKITNASFIEGQNRYVSKVCSYAYLSTDNWQFLLGDTIQYMIHNCDPKFTSFNNIKKNTWIAVQHNIADTMKWKHDKWIEAVKEKCGTTNCNYKDMVVPPSLREHNYNADKPKSDKGNPCLIDVKSPACLYYKYKQQGNVTNTSFDLKARNDMAGEMNYNQDKFEYQQGQANFYKVLLADYIEVTDKARY